MHTIVTFQNKVMSLLGEGEYDGMLELLGKNPKVGVLFKGTGKSGGTGLVYYYRNENKSQNN